MGILAADGLAALPSYYAARIRSLPADCRSPGTYFKRRLSNKSYFSKGCLRFQKQRESERGGCLKVRAMESSADGKRRIAPLELESPTGQLLSQILHTHPHLLPAAIDQQLENLQSDRKAEKKETPPGAEDLLLYRRIAEVKKKESEKTIQEIIYCLIVHKFIESNITMIPSISQPPHPSMDIDSWPNQEHKLESLHSPDALEMIRSHLSLVIDERSAGPLSSSVQISKLKLGKLYAASIMYGYFLKRVDERYQLERSMNTLPPRIDDPRIVDNVSPNPFWDMESMVQITPDGESLEGGDDGRSYRLRSYVMYLDAETLQRYATIRSKEAISLIERQTQALFGRPDIRLMEDGTIDTRNDVVVSVSYSGLTVLILEAVAFGSFLWEAESYVESKYQFQSV